MANPILSSFLLLLFLSITTVIAQDTHDDHEGHDHGTPPPPPMTTVPLPPPPPVNTIPPPPPAVEEDHDHDHEHEHETVPSPPPPPPAPVVNIFDTTAQPVISGEKYYILPVVQRRGGGITTAPKDTYEKCPLYVVQDNNTAAVGVPVTFNPITPGSSNIITFSTNMNIIFAASTGCKQSTWTLKPGNGNETQFMTLGGSNGYGGPNAIKSWFKIERFFPRFNFDYKLVFCPNTNQDTCGDAGNVGVFIQPDGTWRLVVGTPSPLRVKFKKTSRGASHRGALSGSRRDRADFEDGLEAPMENAGHDFGEVADE
ncbi:hypothetical protein SOVF_136170, partial [Spinacia oleracea]